MTVPPVTAREADDGTDARSRAQRRARRVEREAVERACSQLASSGELTDRRRAVVEALASRLRTRLVEDTVASASEASSAGECSSENEMPQVDPEIVARLFCE